MGERSDYRDFPSDYSKSESGNRRNPIGEKETNQIGPNDTVFRYLCQLRKIGSIIGIGGDIAKQLRADTQAKIRIGETIPGCEERVVTIYSSSEETNSYGDELVCPAQDALFRVHDKVMAEETSVEQSQEVVVRLLVPSDQVGCVIGKGGQVIKGIRDETHAQVRILGSEHLPPCALSSDELIQISGEGYVVKNALYEVAFRLHENPSRSQQLLLTVPSIYRTGIAFNNPSAAGPPFVSSYGNYRNNGKDRSFIPKEFAVRLVCRTENLGSVIGKGGAVIKQIRQESGAFIVVDSAGADENDCIISVSAKETYESSSRVIDAVMRLLPRCSDRVEDGHSEAAMTARLLVPSSKIGCLIGKGGAIIKEMRSSSRANIRIFSDENVPRIASEDDELVQIAGDQNASRNALLQVLQRLRVNAFETEGGSSSAYGPRRSTYGDEYDGSTHVNDDRTQNQGFAYVARPSASDNSDGDEASQLVADRNGYGAYGGYSSGGQPTAGSFVDQTKTNVANATSGRSLGYQRK